MNYKPGIWLKDKRFGELFEIIEIHDSNWHEGPASCLLIKRSPLPQIRTWFNINVIKRQFELAPAAQILYKK